MFYAKMNDDDDELPRYEEEDEGLEQPHDGDVIEEGEETIVEIGMGEEEPETPSQAPGRKQASPAKKAKKATPKKKAKTRAKPKAKSKAKSKKKKPAKKSARRKKR